MPTGERNDEGKAQAYRRARSLGRWLAAAGGGLGAAAVVLGLAVVPMVPPFGTEPLFRVEHFHLQAATACLCAAVVTPWLWLRLAADGRTFRSGGGIFAGLLAVAVTHVVTPFSLVLLDLSAMVQSLTQVGLVALIGPAGAGVFTMMVLGWVTLPLGALCGWLVTAACRWRLKRSPGWGHPRGMTPPGCAAARAALHGSSAPTACCDRRRACLTKIHADP